MSVRVRFAPSPTGHLHIGGARTALYSYLYAKATGGTFVLRVEDTDLERSKREFEEEQIADLKWLGVDYTEGPDRPGDFGPYRQSERVEIYQKYANEFVEKGLAYPCFLTDDELEELTEKAKSEEKPFHIYHDKYRDLPPTEAKAKINAGEKYVIRFKNPRREYTFHDLVRGDVTFPEDMVGDFVILRSNGMPVYNFCCVVDDHLMQMTHVIRADDHLNNTLRQLMIYEALGADLPKFAHVSLLVGEDRQKLSKRHGATSVTQYREEGYLPEALTNYLCLLGWSHPEEKDIFNINELGEVFGLDRFSKSPALYDVKKLAHFNSEHIKKLSLDKLKELSEIALKDNEQYQKMDTEWRKTFLEFYQEKLTFLKELNDHVNQIFNSQVEKNDELNEVLGWETTPVMKTYLQEQVNSITEINSDTIATWMDTLKKEHKIKGKNLFKGMRAVLTGKTEGPDLKTLLALTPINVVKNRLEQI